MPDVSRRGIPRHWRLGLELLVFLVAAGALLAQIGCESTGYASGSVVQLKDVEFRPDFDIARDTEPAPIRYWVGPSHPIHVRWGQIIVGTGCNFCDRQNCPEPRPTFTADPVIVVSFREQNGADAEDGRFPYTFSCSLTKWDAKFTPRPPETGKEEERNYLASIQFGDGSPIPATSPGSVPIRIIPKIVTMPPRRLQPIDSKTWAWPSQFEGQSPRLYEAFDPKLQVGKVRIVQGGCGFPKAPILPDLERERLQSECGDDKFLDAELDASLLIVPYRVTVTNELNSEDYQQCESVEGEVDFGRDADRSRLSRCRGEDSQPRNFVALTPTLLSQSRDRRRLVWKVEFDEEKGFPPPPRGTELWIFFTLEPLP